MINIKNDGKAIAFVHVLGDNGVLGLLTKHYLLKMNVNKDDRDYTVTMPRTLTVYVLDNRVSVDKLRQDREIVMSMFGVGFTVQTVDPVNSSADIQSDDTLIFVV